MSLDSFCHKILSKRAQNFILGVIVMNAITLGLETSPWVMEHAGWLVRLLDQAALAIFTVELVMKMVALRWRFLRDPWNIFDFIIVAISYVPATEGLTVLRSLRVLRVLRLVSGLEKLRIIVKSLLISLPSIGWISLLMSVLFYVCAVMATKLFGSAFPEWFGSLGASVFTLFQVMTLESWSMGIARPVMDTYPLAYLFFVPFVLLSSFVVLNVFIAIIVNGMSDARENRDIETEDDDMEGKDDISEGIREAAAPEAFAEQGITVLPPSGGLFRAAMTAASATSALALAEAAAGHASVLSLTKESGKTVIGRQISATHIEAAAPGVQLTATVSPLLVSPESHVWNVEISDATGKRICSAQVTNSITDAA